MCVCVCAVSGWVWWVDECERKRDKEKCAESWQIESTYTCKFPNLMMTHKRSVFNLNFIHLSPSSYSMEAFIFKSGHEQASI